MALHICLSRRLTIDLGVVVDKGKILALFLGVFWHPRLSVPLKGSHRVLLPFQSTLSSLTRADLQQRIPKHEDGHSKVDATVR